MPSEASLLFVQHLCLQAGSIMENASVHLAHALPADLDERAARLLRIQRAAADISSLMNAAEALNRRGNGPTRSPRLGLPGTAGSRSSALSRAGPLARLSAKPDLLRHVATDL